ncbi:cag [Halictus rubicundus]|uniref:cag n=1 Tax=Halictus rubicundus TaxID=77578 RepID=UPI004035A82A
MSGKRKKVTLTIQKKLEALFRIDNGESLKRVAIDLGVGTSTVSDWKKNRKEIEDFCAKMVSRDGLDNRGTIKKAKNATLDNALYIWYVQERENGVAISGPMLRKKALSLNEKLGGDPTFTASVGWLGRWKGRHGIKLNLSSECFLSNSTSSEKTNCRPLLEDDYEPERMVICSVTEDEEDTQSSLRSRCEDLKNLDHAEAVVMLEKLITYFDRQGDTLEAELITLRRLFDRASKKC